MSDEPGSEEPDDEKPPGSYDKLLKECEHWEDKGLPASLEDPLPVKTDGIWWHQPEYLSTIKFVAKCVVRALIPIGIILVLWLGHETMETSQEVTGERVNRLERMMYSIEMEKK